MKFFTLLIIIVFFVGENLADDWILLAHRMYNPNEYPVLANGHVGFTVFDESVYMNGLYNGLMAESHRARIENHANVQSTVCDTKARTFNANNCVYQFNVRDGIFETIYDSEDFGLVHKVFPHRYYTRTIVNKFTLERRNAKGNITVKVATRPGDIALDTTFPDMKKLVKEGLEFTCEQGSTLQVENVEIQDVTQKIAFCYSQLNELFMPEGQTKMNFYNYMIVDHGQGTEDSDVLSELNRVVTDARIEEKHSEMWHEFWNNFDIEIDSRLDMNKLIRSSIYYLVSNLPSPVSFLPDKMFYGVSSSGLGRVDPETKGRITWDMDIFMQLPLLLIDPEYSKDLLDYRYRVHADDKLSGGWMYFWETGYTGAHLDIYQQMVQATHVPADVAFAVRQHLSATQDLDWFRNTGCEIAYNTAKYWARRVAYNSTTDLYDLQGVAATGAEDDDLTRNAFVNVAAGLNMYLGDFASCACEMPKIADLNEKARSLTLPLDIKDDLVKVHAGYETYIRTKSADAMLTIWPLQYDLEDAVKNNTLNHYRRLILKDAPPTTWALHLIGDLAMKRTALEHSLYYHMTSNYVTKPFMVWTDQSEPGPKTVYNFVSGAAAFLQVLMNGYGGIRLHFDRLEIKEPKLPPDTTRLKIKGVNYLGVRFSLEITEKTYTMILTEKSLNKDLRLIGEIEGVRFPFNEIGENVTAKLFEKVTLQNEIYPYGDCKMPKNIIGVPKSERSLMSIKERARENSPRIILICVFVAFAAILMAILFILYRRHGTVLPNPSMRYVRNVA